MFTVKIQAKVKYNVTLIGLGIIKKGISQSLSRVNQFQIQIFYSNHNDQRTFPLTNLVREDTKKVDLNLKGPFFINHSTFFFIL